MDDQVGQQMSAQTSIIMLKELNTMFRPGSQRSSKWLKYTMQDKHYFDMVPTKLFVKVQVVSGGKSKTKYWIAIDKQNHWHAIQETKFLSNMVHILELVFIILFWASNTQNYQSWI